jgi:hypothetical protein
MVVNELIDNKTILLYNIHMPHWPNWLEVLDLESRGSPFESEVGHQFNIGVVKRLSLRAPTSSFWVRILASVPIPRKDAIMTDDANTKPEFKIVFSPGSFDNFEGTQEELDEIVAEINRMVSTGEIIPKSIAVNDDDWEALPDHVKDSLIAEFEDMESEPAITRILH